VKNAKIFIRSGIFILLIIAVSAFVNTRRKLAANDKGFVVIELFTSEGCSSCPPADAVVAKIQKESNNKPVYILAFHVDYWNSAAWKDAFSGADYSHRQKQYAAWLHLQSVYTPQIVVNGKTEFVGSEEGTLRNAIKTSLQVNAIAWLTLSDVKVNRNKLSLQYLAQGNTGNSVLILALLQKSAQTKVAGGENGGRTLSHVQIVRGLKEIKLKGSNGAAEIDLPTGFDTTQGELIAFIQNTSSGTITGATSTGF
jgi:hypothetical protein